MLEERIRERASELGFRRVGFARAGPVEHAARLREWLDDGFHGEMQWMATSAAARSDTRALDSRMRSVISLAAPYGRVADGEILGGGWARYAVGPDYHDVLGTRLVDLASFVASEAKTEIRSLAAVDVAPLLERGLALEAGVGWLGKNAMLVEQELGSYFFLAELLVDIELAPTLEAHADRCGSCTRCIDACPTGAIVEPYRVDARRCISYLTIELQGPIPRRLRGALGTRLFGCDACQEACPWNAASGRAATGAPAVAPERFVLDAAGVLALDGEGFSSVFRGSAVKRAKRRGLARNAAVVLGNSGDRACVKALVTALRSDVDPLVRGHAGWALGVLGGRAARVSLELAALHETNAYVRDELRHALREGT